METSLTSSYLTVVGREKVGRTGVSVRFPSDVDGPFSDLFESLSPWSGTESKPGCTVCTSASYSFRMCIRGGGPRVGRVMGPEGVRVFGVEHTTDCWVPIPLPRRGSLGTR